MMSQYGDRKGDDWRDLSHELEGVPCECAGCHKRVESDDLDEDDLCPACEAEDDELEEMGDISEGLDSDSAADPRDYRDDQDHALDMRKDGEAPMADLRVRR